MLARVDRAAGVVPDRRGDRAVDVVAARRAGARGGPGARRRRAAAAASAAPPAGGRAQPHLRPDLDGHRHRRRPAHPARHRRRGDLRPQLRHAVAVGPAGRRGRPACGRPWSRRSGCCCPACSWWPGVAGHPAGAGGPADGGRAGQLPRATGCSWSARSAPSSRWRRRPRARWSAPARRSRSSSSARRGASPPSRCGSTAPPRWSTTAAGFVARPGMLTVVVSAVPEQSAALADRLGRYLPPDTEPVGEDDVAAPEGPRRPAGAGDRERRRGARSPSADEQAAGRDVGRAPRRGRPVGGPARRRTPHGAGERHRQRAVRGHAAGRRRPARSAHARAGRGRAAGGQRRGRLRRAAGGLAGPARRARPWPVGGSAPARRAGPGARGRRAGAGPGRADVRGRRAHRGADRASGSRRCASGRTTVVCTVSPLWLHHADRVVLLHDDGVVARASTPTCSENDAAYRRVVARALDDDLQGVQQ